MVEPSALPASREGARGTIVSAATRLFAARGFDGTAVQDVADAVGVTKPAILHHFPSKEHLRKAVLDGIVAHWNQTLPRLLLAASASKGRFDAVFGELHRFFREDPYRARVVIRELLNRPLEMKKALRGPLRQWLRAVADYIRAGMEAGHHFADVDPEAYVVHMLQLVIGAAASSAVLTAALEGGGHQRYDRELARIARASLFAPHPATKTAPPPRPSQRRPKKGSK